ncbi:MAG: LIC_13355 family lipoprotein [Leptospiraceae bacterium]
MGPLTEKIIPGKLHLALLTLLACSACSPSTGGDESLLLAAALPSGGSGDQACLEQWPFSVGAYLADASVNAAVGPETFDDPTRATNKICGGGWTAGSTDVYSTGTSSECESGEKCIVLEWTDKKVLNATGIDFVVYENPFLHGTNPNSRFLEPVIVEVSIDGSNWCGWNPNYSGSSGATDLRNPGNYSDLAAITPVTFKQSDSNTLTADDLFTETTDSYGTHLKGGGDGFDLDASSFGNTGSGCNSTIRDNIRSSGFVYLRLTTAYTRDSSSFPLANDSFDQEADIDGAVARSVADR